MSNNFALSEEQTMVLDTVRKFVQDQAGPNALEHDEHRTFVAENVEQLAEMGMLGLPLSEDAGGAEMGMLAFAVALQELGGACGSTARLVLSQAGLCGKALDGVTAAAEACQAVASGESLACWIGPEVGISANATDDGVVLSGSAPMATAAERAETWVVAAREEGGEALLICTDATGIAREAVPALGFRASAPAAARFDGVTVPSPAIVARGADAEAAWARAALAGNIGAAAIAVGIAQAAYEVARRHTHERIAFGKPLFAQQAVQDKLVNSLRKTEAARHMVFHAARLADDGEDAATAAMMARMASIEAAVESADEAVQMLGGYGYTVEYHVERHYRDAQTLEVMDHSRDAMRRQLAEQIQLTS